MIASVVVAFSVTLVFVVMGFANSSRQPARSTVTPEDRIAAEAYLSARNASERTAMRGVSATDSAAHRVVKNIVRSCPLAVTNAPHQSEGGLSRLGSEGIVTVWRAILRSQRANAARFAMAVEGLQWSSPEIGRMVRLISSEEIEQSKLPLPSVCRDIAIWIDSGYRHISSATTSLLEGGSGVLTSGQAAAPIYNLQEPRKSLGGMILRRLGPYETSSEKIIAERVAREEIKVIRSYAKILDKANTQISNGLGF
jgi:hypothetical protein